MDAFAAVLEQARLYRETCLNGTDGTATSAVLLKSASSNTKLHLVGLPDGDPLLSGGEAALDREADAIFYRKSVPEDLAAFHKAHEFAHFWLEKDSVACQAADIQVIATEEQLPFGSRRVEGYSPKERRECSANVFAREFLLPALDARHLFVAKGETSSAIAKRLQLPPGLVRQQLIRGLLLPEPLPTPEKKKAKPQPPLDKSQKDASEIEAGPFLLEAGPGTGKTRTLIARIVWLGSKAVPPSSILALTFSNKAAEELRERVALAWPDGAPSVWSGTFHAFGLELLRKYGERIGLPTTLRVLDPNGALQLLESELPSLPINHYLQLYEPAGALVDVLKAISRAKDELVSPKQYLDLARAMKAASLSKDQLEAAEKAEEVGHIYAAYEAVLAREKAIDFGDLIFKTHELLERHGDIREQVQNAYPHILVDEYQDMNRASGKLLRQLAGPGRGLWVVGDARQSIYRFRGASPRNIRSFESDFLGGTRAALSTNYRSQDSIVRIVEQFAPAMRASVGGLPAIWKSDRGNLGGSISMHVATDLPAEAEGIAGAISARLAAGVPYRDQAVLCRSHSNLAKIAEHLENSGIPVLYLGDIFERPEIRDLLSLLSLEAETASSGLVRVAHFPEYSVPLADVRLVLEFQKTQKVSFPDAIARIAEVGVTPAGLQGLTSLNDHLKACGSTGAAGFLTKYLFDQSRYLEAALAAPGVKGQQIRLAIYQFLQTAQEYQPRNRTNPIKDFLDWVRRLELFGEEKQLRAPPAAAGDIDAVRLLTVHASKGLEFSAVYMPVLSTTGFPAKGRPNPCPPPVGLIPEETEDSQLEEEECLFFVALSRARDTLCLSRAEMYGSPRKHSPFLASIRSMLDRAPDAVPDWTSSSVLRPSPAPYGELGLILIEHRAEDLDQYKRCPLTYLYQRVLGLNGGREDNAYVCFHRAVYSVLRTLKDLPANEEAARATISARLDEAWAKIGPVGDPFEKLFYREAAQILETARKRWQVANVEDVEWVVPVGSSSVRVRPDVLERQGAGLTARRLRTGKTPKSKPDDDIYALYYAASRHSGQASSVEVLYLTSDEIVPVAMSEKVIGNRIEKYAEAISSIAAGHFPPEPDDRSCPRCPQYFICPAVIVVL